MSKAVKIILIIASAILAIIIIAIAAIFLMSNSRLNKPYSAPKEEIKIPTDKASIERGKHLVEAVGKCQDCHFNDLGGAVVIDDPMIGKIYAPNLTGLAEEDEEEKAEEAEEWVAAIRHGIHHGKSVVLMPAQAYYYFNDSDLSSIIAYLFTLSKVDRKEQDNSIGPMGRLLIVKGDLPLPASLIDHDAKRPADVKEGVTKEYGKYLVNTGGCPDCHQKNLGGGKIGFAPPGTPSAPNLTPGGELKEWSLEDFTKMLREGKTESDRTLNTFMPWKYTKNLTDDEIEAMFLYLKSVPAVKGEEHEEEEHAE